MDTNDSKVFEEFMIDFIGFESDGQTREANPIVESRIPKTTNRSSEMEREYRGDTAAKVQSADLFKSVGQARLLSRHRDGELCGQCDKTSAKLSTGI